jgi:lipid II:glycine glycyltransferase (peptidoglycan interpeptide bridge formation enzyme)
MTSKDITERERHKFNSIATHPLQSYEWGEFRARTGIKVIRRGFYEGDNIISGLQLTIHKIPHTKWTIGYVPKGTMPNKDMLEELIKIGKANNCIFIQLEPNEKKEASQQELVNKLQTTSYKILSSAHPLFTKYTFQLDLTKTEDELLKQMHSKTRYNIRVAQKHDVVVKEQTSEQAFQEYLKLTEETTNRQGFFAHTKKYHQLMWETLGEKKNTRHDELSAHLLIAYYKNIPLTTWILFVFHDTLYYPYGASSSTHREVMASNLMMWEAIRFGKKLGLKTFDMWGSLGENPDPKDAWYGFHKFKMGYSPKLVEFVGSYDLIINPFAYQFYKVVDKVRWLFLKMKF